MNRPYGGWGTNVAAETVRGGSMRREDDIHPLRRLGDKRSREDGARR